VSSPEGFTLPLSDAADERKEPASLPLAPPASLPIAPPAPLPVAEPSSIPVAPPASIPMGTPTSIAVSVPDALSSLQSLEDDDFAPTAPPSAGDVGIVSVERTGPGQGAPEVAIDEVLLYLLEKGGSDLHLSVNSPPMIRVHGDLEAVPGYRALTAQQLQESIYSILTDRQKQRFEETKELDLAYEMPGAARFRVNLMQQRGAISAVLRAIPWEILPLDALNMPSILADFADLPRGLVLVTGPTGSGKSTTLAAIIDKANRTRKGHIITIEDPIEFVHQHRQCVVNQREVGQDTMSFEAALKHALRQDPDIILVGEMRDLETIAIALTAAETGHLVFGTLHTSSAATTIDRIIDVFPPSQQQQIRTQLANSVQAVVCQALCRTADRKGRVAATEVMVATPAVRNLIREGKLQSIPSALQTGSRFGMHTLNQDLASLVEKGRITYEVAREKASDLSELNQLLGKAADATD
jgi:twitching motility protein PilT